MRNKLPLFLVKVFYYEYWPFWLFFLPLVPYWVYLSIRSRSFTYFTAVNPAIPHSGVFGESKSEIMNLINGSYLPKSVYLERETSFDEAMIKIQSTNLEFPIIAKPDVGERGTSVEKIDNLNQLEHYILKSEDKIILQEYVDFPIELGVLHYRLPVSGKSGISSIVMKEFMGVTGDGHSSIRALLNQNERYKFQISSLENKYGSRLDEILEDGEYVNLQPIGNHCLGTKFLSGQHLINDKLLSVFDQIADDIPGFYQGRFDLKVTDIESLYKGENIRILELNGVTSEPGHIYDPKLNLFKAYRDTAYNMKIMSDISIENMKLGVQVTPFKRMLKLIISHFSEQRLEHEASKKMA